MQEIHHHPMLRGDGGSERFYSGGIGSGDGGDRRMRPQQSHHNIHQALKCPRCNSLNTKFCYYNNYNLSQPRHFCKNCRRYWTKGGVLRNVPIGGGCRKAKRSKPNISSSSAAAGGSTVKPPPDAVSIEREGEGMSRASHSSSDSSSLSAVAVTHIRPGSASAAEVASVSISGFSMNSTRPCDSGIEWSAMDGGIFSELGSYTDLISTAPANETAAFGFGGNTVNLNQQCLDHLKVDGETVNQQSEDRTAEVEFVGRSSDPSDGFGPLDWGGAGVDQVLFDLTSTVDHEYWSQSQWTTDQDHNGLGLYLP